MKAFLACSTIMPYSATEVSDFFRCWKTLSVHFDRRAVWGWVIFRRSSAKSTSSMVENRVHPMPRWLVRCCLLHHPVNLQVEEQGRHGTSLSNTGLHTEAGFAVSHSALEVVVAALDEKDDQLWNSMCLEYSWMMSKAF